MMQQLQAAFNSLPVHNKQIETYTQGVGIIFVAFRGNHGSVCSHPCQFNFSQGLPKTTVRALWRGMAVEPPEMQTHVYALSETRINALRL